MTSFLRGTPLFPEHSASSAVESTRFRDRLAMGDRARTPSVVKAPRVQRLRKAIPIVRVMTRSSAAPAPQ